MKKIKKDMKKENYGVKHLYFGKIKILLKVKSEKGDDKEKRVIREIEEKIFTFKGEGSKVRDTGRAFRDPRLQYQKVELVERKQIPSNEKMVMEYLLRREERLEPVKVEYNFKKL